MATTVGDLKTKTMYKVEKFFPDSCPNCTSVFQLESDFQILPQKFPRRDESVVHERIRCSECGNITVAIPLEEYIFETENAAQEKMLEEFAGIVLRPVQTSSESKPCRITTNELARLTVRRISK